jgi:hypothetical protein
MVKRGFSDAQGGMSGMLGEVASYSDLHRLLRGRANELGLSRESLDAVSGLQPGYSAKLLSPRPQKRLGVTSLPLLLEALAVRLILVADDEKAADLHKRITLHPRKASAVRNAVVHIQQFTRRRFQKMGRKGGALSRAYMPRKKATALAKRAARVRWKRAA